jgi:tripartite-type tricarboxylate transporter receptor subunit TctC
MGLAAGASAAMLTRARAAAWPERTVRLIIPFTPGGPTDIQGRVIAEKLQAKWGQPVVVENKPGAGSTIGSAIVAQAEPDGYTLLLQGSAHATNASLFLNLPYHPVRSFTPIMGVSYQPVILTVHPSVPVKTLKEFIDLAKREPDTITMGVAGTGNISHLAGILLEQQAGIKLVTVPFGGSSQAQTALLGGHIKGSFLNSTVGTPVIKSGDVRGIASASKGRWRELPDLPTIAEQGFPDFECTSWYGLLGPKGLPEPIALKIYEDVRATLRLDDVRERLFANGLDILDWSPKEFTAVMEADMEKWPPIISRGGLKPQ